MWWFTSRTRASPVKITANKLFADEDTRGDDDECADSTAAAEPRYICAPVDDFVFMQPLIKH
jgi:hypothetical protein